MRTGTANDHRWMLLALSLAEKATEMGEVPVGAVLVHEREQELLSSGYNQPISRHDPTAHAEIIALRQACQVLGNYRLPGTTLYVTLEPCCMCAGALIHARVDRVVFAAADPKTGAAGSVFNLLGTSEHNHKTTVDQGLCEKESRELLQTFFKQRRNRKT